MGIFIRIFIFQVVKCLQNKGLEGSSRFTFLKIEGEFGMDTSAFDPNDKRSSISSINLSPRSSPMGSRRSSSTGSLSLPKLKEQQRELERQIRQAGRNKRLSLQMREFTLSNQHQTDEFKEDPLKNINRTIITVNNEVPKLKTQLAALIEQIRAQEAELKRNAPPRGCFKCVIL